MILLKRSTLVLLLLFVMCDTGVMAQHPLGKTYDFSNTQVDKDSLLNIIQKKRSLLDSMYYQIALDSLELLYRYHATDTRGYNSFFLIGGYVSSQYDALLNELLANGFNEVGNGASAIGYGASFKRKRFVHDVYFAPYISDWMEGSNGDRVRVGGGAFLNYTTGFDFVYRDKVQVYALAGLILQSTALNYERNTVGTPANSLFDFVGSATEFSVSKTDLLFTYGGALDWHIQFSERDGGVTMGVRGGLTTPVIQGNYKMNGEKSGYSPDLSLSESYFLFVLKFYTRRIPRINR